MNNLPLILIVEDSPVQAFFLEKILKNNQFRVLAATNGQDALQCVQTQLPDLIISDINMPVMSGYEMCRILKDNPRQQAIPVILLSELSTMEEILLGLEARADNYILKPYEEADLIRKIWELLRVSLSQQQESAATRTIEMTGGRRFHIDSNRDQVLNFLLSIYESILRKNSELNQLHDKMNRLNADLLASKEKYQTLVQTVPDMIFQLDAKGRFTFINHVLERLGYSTEELLGQHFSSIIAAEQAERISFAHLLKQLKGGAAPKSTPKLIDERRAGKRQTLGLEVHLRPKHSSQMDNPESGEREEIACTGEISSAGMYSAPVRDGQGRFIGTVGVLRDISARKHVEETLKRTYLQLQQSERRAELANRAKGEFLANISHEIRTPMHAILGLSQLLLQSKLDRKQRGYMEKVVRSGRKLLAILNDILDISKVEAGKIAIERVQFNLDEVIADLLDVATWYGEGKAVSVQVALADDLPRFWVGDPLRIGQILANLLSNAIKFTEKGEVVVAVKELIRDKKRAVLQFSVRDSGVGMEPEQVEKLFQAFQQADGSITRRYGGTGLGLAISRHLVELLGGSIYAQSSLGQGTVFTFLLPMLMAEQQESALPHWEKEERVPQQEPLQHQLSWQALFRLRGVKVLIVDDHEINLLIAKEILDQVGIKADVAVNGRQAIEMIARQHYDCVLMDIQMPVMDGLEACRVLRQLPEGQQLPIVAMTAHGMHGDRERSLAAGMNDHIIKPLDPERLYQVMLRLITLPGVDGGEASASDSTGAGSALAAERDDNGLEALDWQAGIRRIGGNEQLYRQIVRRFLLGQKETTQQLRTALMLGDRITARRLVHGVRGLAAGIGALPLSSLAGELEQAIVDELESPVLVNQFIQSLSGVLQLLSALMTEEESPSCSIPDRMDNLTEVDVQAILAQMYDDLDGDFNAARRSLEQLLPLLQRRGTDPALLSQLILQMTEFETERVQQIIIELLEQMKQNQEKAYEHKSGQAEGAGS
ncbi:response regulator [Candidatus Magnetaquicoccus inordinatus]|uniref:response regulator n=1 Tax=Candidatus Magnetaquicoccus inordinatus TaxID=2496818 RepID=UPI00102BC8C6|nr:response regulator [Candidatus Magnetaquicoccus inordinatus]